MGSDAANVTTGYNAHALDVLLECDYDYAVALNLRNADIRGARIQAYGKNNVSGVVYGAYINCQLGAAYTYNGQIMEGISSFGGIGLEVRLETSGTGTVAIGTAGSGNSQAVALLVSTRIANAFTGNVSGIWVERPYEGTTNVSGTLTGINFGLNGLYATGTTTDWDIGIDLGESCTIGIDIDDCTTGINMADATVGGDDIVLSATGVINAATSIVFEIAGTPVVTITSSGWGDVVPSTITSTTDPQFTIKYDAQEYMTLGVSSAGACKIKTYAAGVDTFEVEADGTITLDAGTDIVLEPAGADVFIDAAKLTVAATSLTIYGGDTAGDDLILRANSSDASNITINGGGDITFDRPFIGTLANSSADNLVEITITDTSTSGETNGYWVQVNRNGALSAADYTIGGNFRVRVGPSVNSASSVFAGIWTSTGVTSGTPTVGTLTGVYIWANQTTGTISDHSGISINMDFDNSAAADNYIKVYNHGTALGDAVIWMANSGTGAATFLLDFEAPLQPFAGSPYYDIAIREGANTRYIPTGNAVTGLVLGRDASGEGILISGTCDDGIAISGDMTTYGLNLSFAGATAGIILSGASGASHIQMSGTATDGLLIDGVCTDAIHISGENTANCINISDSATAGVGLNFSGTGGPYKAIEYGNLAAAKASDVSSTTQIMPIVVNYTTATGTGLSSNIMGVKAITNEQLRSQRALTVWSDFAVNMTAVYGITIGVTRDNTASTVASDVYCLNVKTNMGTDATSTGSWVYGIKVEMDGHASTVQGLGVAGMYMFLDSAVTHGIIVESAAGKTVQFGLLHLNATGTTAHVIHVGRPAGSTNYLSLGAVGGCLSADATGDNWTHRLKVTISGVGDRYIKLSDA